MQNFLLLRFIFSQAKGVGGEAGGKSRDPCWRHLKQCYQDFMLTSLCRQQRRAFSEIRLATAGVDQFICKLRKKSWVFAL